MSEISNEALQQKKNLRFDAWPAQDHNPNESNESFPSEAGAIKALALSHVGKYEARVRTESFLEYSIVPYMHTREL